MTPNKWQIPTKDEFLKGIEKFEKEEPRDAMYNVARHLVENFWGKPSDMADGLGVLLLTWNQAFYRYGIFDFEKLEDCVTENLQTIKSFKNRDISSLSNADENKIKELFTKFYKALQRASGKKKGEKSPVAVAKALHVLAPRFFPLWDTKIAQNYNCHYSKNPSEKYIEFCKITKLIANKVRTYRKQKTKTLNKLIDEYNYAKYTKNWI